MSFIGEASTGRTVHRDEATIGDLYDMSEALIGQVDMLETVLAMLACVLLADHGHYETEPPGDLVTTALDCLGEFLGDYDRNRQQRQVITSFLQARE